MTQQSRSGNTPDETRGKVTDRKRGCDSQPRFAASEFPHIEVESLFLNVLPRRSVAIS
jgi:hypothetical protein